MKLKLFFIAISLCGFWGEPIQARDTVREVFEYAHQTAEAQFKKGNFENSFDIYKKLARYGDKYAMYRLALAYENGFGVESDLALASAWARMAAETKNIALVENASRVSQRLKDQQFAKSEEHYQTLFTEYSEMAVALRMQEDIKDRKKNITGSRTGHVFGPLVVKVGDHTYDGESYYGAIINTGKELETYIGMNAGSVSVREENSQEKSEDKSEPLVKVE